MKAEKISKKDVVDLLITYFKKRVNEKEAKRIAKQIDYPFTFLKPKKKLHILSELILIHLFLINHGCFLYFRNNSSLGQQTFNNFYQQVFKTIISPTLNSRNFLDGWEEKVALRFEQYDKVVDLEGGTMFATTFIGNVFDNFMAGLSFSAISIQAELLADLNSFVSLLNSVEIVD